MKSTVLECIAGCQPDAGPARNRIKLTVGTIIAESKSDCKPGPSGALRPRGTGMTLVTPRRFDPALRQHPCDAHGQRCRNTDTCPFYAVGQTSQRLLAALAPRDVGQYILLNHLRLATFNAGWDWCDDFTGKYARLECELDIVALAADVAEHHYLHSSPLYPHPTVTRPQLRAALRELVAGRVVRYSTQPGEPDRGVVAWNTNTDEWLPLRLGYNPATWLPIPVSSLQPRIATARWEELRRLVFERDDYTCGYCGQRGGTLHCDHIIPRVQGGTDEPDNLVTACDVCNLSKHGKTPQEWSRWLMRQRGSR